jgi:aryl-alcohol dehydrogenase-like predicted oxidoreductase
MFGLELTRREILQAGLGAAMGAFCLEGASGQSKSAMQSGTSSMLSRPIPKSGEPLPVVGLGTWQTFDLHGPGQEWNDAKEVLRLLVEHGGRVVDSSPMYGASESVVGQMAAELGITKKLFLATKVWTSGRQQGIQQMESSMRKLRTDRIDLMQVHNLLDVQTQLETLREWKKQGKIRYIGITHYSRSGYAALERLMTSETDLDFVQVNYSLAERDAEQRILPTAAERKIAVLVNRPFATGQLFGRTRGKALPEWAKDFDCQSWAQFFLKFILGNPAVTCAIPATGNPRHLVDNLGAGTGRMPDEAMRQKMVAYFQSL